MKKQLLVLFSAAILYCGCKKDNIVNTTTPNSFKISFITQLNDVSSESWEQVLGGEAVFQYIPKSNDTLSLSAVKDSLDLKDLSAYNYQLVAGGYNITLSTKSTAVADTFIRFYAAKNVTVNKDETISLPATTNDGVITINASIIDGTIIPTFTPDGTDEPIDFGVAKGYYFLYIKGSSSGRLAFTAAATGDIYLKDLDIAAGNQYAISAKPNDASAIAINAYPFHLKANLQ